MSRTAVIVALLVVLVLGGVAFFLTNKGSGPAAATGPLLSFDPATVTELRMDFPNGTFQAMQRDAAFGWKIVLGQPGTPVKSWPAAAAQSQSALRLLGNLTEERPGDGSISKPAGTLRINAGETMVCTLVFGEQRLGGRVLVEASGSPKRMAWIDAKVADMMVTTGPQAWRSMAALPGIGAEASRITMKAQGGNAISLARVQGKWALREPVAAPAEADEINKLIGVLGKVQIVDFCDKGPPAATGLENPNATLVIETDERDAAGVLTTIKQTLTVGQAADMNQETMVAKLERTVSGKGPGYAMVVIVGGEGLQAINTNPATYVSKRAIQFAAADVGQMQIYGLDEPASTPAPIHRRSANGWETKEPLKAEPLKADWTPAVPEVAQFNDALLALLADTPAEIVSIAEIPEAERPRADGYKLSTPGGDLLADCVVLAKQGKITVYVGGLKRDYAAGVSKAVQEGLGRRQINW